MVRPKDATIALVARVLAGEVDALDALKETPEDYQLELVGMYGYYYLDLASDVAQVEDAVELMEAANITMQRPVLAMSIIKGYQQMGQPGVAREKARELAAALPGNEKVQALAESPGAG